MAEIQILVVEDDILVAESIRAMLANMGYAVPDVVVSGEEAVQQVQELQPDLVLMDIRLTGEMDGVEAAEQIRTRFDVPVVYLTAYADSETTRRAKVTEPFGYLIKPFDARELGNAIEMALYKHEMDSRLRQQNRELMLLNRASQVFSSTLDLDQVLAAVLEEVRRLLGAIACSIWLLDPALSSQEENLRKGEGWGLVCLQAAGPQSEVVRGWRLAPGQGIAGWTAHTGESLIVPDICANDHYFPGVDQATGLGLRSVLSVPLRIKQDVIGVVQAVDTEVDRFSQTDLNLLESLAGIAAIHIENARLYQQARQEIAERQRAEGALRRRTEELDALRQVGLELTAQLDLEALLHSVVSRAMELLGGSASGLALYRPERDVLESVTNAGKAVIPIGGTFRRGENVSGKIWETGEPLALDRYENWRGQKPGSEGSPPIVAVLGVPIYWGATDAEGEFLGTLVVKADPPRTFSSADVELLNLFATQAAIAIRNARLFDQVHQGRERLETLSRRLLEIQESERRHIARELHDEIGQILTGLNLLLEVSARASSDRAKARLGDARTMIGELMERVDELSLDLRPAMLDDLGLLPTLLWYVERYTSRTGVQVRLEHSGLEARFTPEVETAAYRVVQEALTNVVRHAGVDEVIVRLWADPDTLTVQVEDEGCGFDPQVALVGGYTSGLGGMHERAVLLGGQLTVESAVGMGTCLIAEWPLRTEEAV